MARIFMLKGDINRPGHVDIPEESTTLREVVEQLGGGMANGKRCKAVQIGGPSGGLLSAEQLGLPRRLLHGVESFAGRFSGRSLCLFRHGFRPIQIIYECFSLHFFRIVIE